MNRYMMATKAIHCLGDISRVTEDICVISDEDESNYIGNWVTGFGLVEVKFPKETTRELTAAEVEHYHGMPISLGNLVRFLNLKEEKFIKPVRLSKDGTEVFSGNLMGPLKVGSVLYIINSEGKFYQSSAIEEINGNTVKTRNSVYRISYL